MQGCLGRAKVLYGRDAEFDLLAAATSVSMQEAVS